MVSGVVVPKQYTITTAVTGLGSVTLSPAGGTYAEGTAVTITANPATGYQFSNWSGSITGTTNPVTVTLTSNISVTANFAQTPGTGDCSSPVTASLPFAKDGAGEFCYVITGNISYVNSWNMSQVTINGVDYTNKWSNSMPARVNGNYYVRYVGQFAWSHFEATGTNSLARELIEKSLANTNGVAVVYPSRVTQRSFTLRVSDPAIKQVTVTLTDLYGKIVLKKVVNANTTIKINSTIATGMYNATVATGDKKIMNTKLIIQ